MFTPPSSLLLSITFSPISSFLLIPNFCSRHYPPSPLLHLLLQPSPLLLLNPPSHPMFHPSIFLLFPFLSSSLSSSSSSSSIPLLSTSSYIPLLTPFSPPTPTSPFPSSNYQEECEQNRTLHSFREQESSGEIPLGIIQLETNPQMPLPLPPAPAPPQTPHIPFFPLLPLI